MCIKIIYIYTSTSKRLKNTKDKINFKKKTFFKFYTNKVLTVMSNIPMQTVEKHEHVSSNKYTKRHERFTVAPLIFSCSSLQYDDHFFIPIKKNVFGLWVF